MQLIVKNCGECPFKTFEKIGMYLCSHPERKYGIIVSRNFDNINHECPEGGAFEIKTSPITIKTDEHESK